MARWHVEGAHLETGESVNKVIEAKDYADLQGKLKAAKILASGMKELKPAQVTPTVAKPVEVDAPSPPNYAISLIVAILFIVSAVGNIGYAGLIKLVALLNSKPSGNDRLDAIEDAANAISAEYHTMVGGACIFAGLILLIMIDIAKNSWAANHRA